MSKIYLDNDRIELAENVTSCGRSTIIFSNNQVKIKSFGPIIPKIEKEVEILPIKNPNRVETKAKVFDVNEVLLGRKCLKDIVNFNNEFIVKANSTITKRHIQQAKKYGKLKELMLFSE